MVIIPKAKEAANENTPIRTERYTQGISITVLKAEKESLISMIPLHFMEPLKMIFQMVKAGINGRMVQNIKELMLTALEKVKVSYYLVMVIPI